MILEDVLLMCNLSKGKNLISMGWSAEQAMEALKIAESEQIQYVDGLNRNFLNLGIIESRNYIRISYGSFLYAGTNGISPFS